jgi:lipopolysaccharide biosynthesis glycosyltransferase
MTERLLLLQPGRDERVNIGWVRKNTVIVHYCGRNKPWKDTYHGRLGCFYREALLRPLPDEQAVSS